MTFRELRREYEHETIGRGVLGRIVDLVEAVCWRYPPTVYSEIGGDEWTDEARDALVQDFVTRTLIESGQLDYAMSQARSMADFDRIVRFQVARHLRHHRRRTVVDNLMNRVRTILLSDPYEALSGKPDRFRLAGSDVEDRPPSERELNSAVRAVALVPREVANPLERGPRVYAAEDLERLVRTLLTRLPCTVRLDDFREVLNRVLTELVPGDLLPLREDSFEEDSVEGAAWTLANERRAAGAAGGLMARPELSPEESFTVLSAARDILSGLGEVERTLLQMKLAGASDGAVAATVSMSRPTVAGRKKAVLERIQEAVEDFDERLVVALLDEVQRGLTS
jgi:hypothetical protein